MKKSLHIILIISFYFVQYIQADTYTTVSDGDWADTLVWDNNKIPASFSDSIIIKHWIIFDKNLNQQYIKIDSNAILCGYRNITIEKNASLYNYGILKLQSLDIYGTGENHGFIHSLDYIIFHAAFNFYITAGDSSRVKVGWDFDCNDPLAEEPEDTTINNNNDSVTDPCYKIFPNPFYSDLKVYYCVPHDLRVTLKIYNTIGQLVAVLFDSFHDEGVYERSLNIDALNLSAGIYYTQLVMGDSYYYTEKLVKLK